jgi:hypothetical protein
VKKIGLYRPEIFIAGDWEFDHVPNAFYFLFRFLWCSLMWRENKMHWVQIESL